MIEAYKRVLRDYRVGLLATLEALGEFLAGLFFLSLPVTFWVTYPTYTLVGKVKHLIWKRRMRNRD